MEGLRVGDISFCFGLFTVYWITDAQSLHCDGKTVVVFVYFELTFPVSIPKKIPDICLPRLRHVRIWSQ